MLDLRELADEWQGLLDERDEARAASLDPREEIDENFADDLQKFGELCDELGIEPKEPSTLRWYADNRDPSLIAEHDFEDYAREFAEDIGAIEEDGRWPVYCIDWERAANDLKMDYTSIEYDGTTYLTRS